MQGSSGSGVQESTPGWERCNWVMTAPGSGELQQAGKDWGGFSDKNVGALNSEQNCNCLEPWDCLGEEAGTGRTRRRSSLSQHCLPKLGLSRAPSAGDTARAGRSGSVCPEWAEQAGSPLLSHCHKWSVQQPLCEGAQASTEPVRLPTVLFPQALCSLSPDLALFPSS